jgi:pantetheine-phosphate adenylyltransferase
MTKAIYPATFDPITLGHVDVATRAAAVFEELTVGVFDRPLKNLLFSPHERWAMTRDALAHLPNVQVVRYGGLTVEIARQKGATVIVRGLRALSDFEWEFQLALTNHRLDSGIETVCLMASEEYSFLSSSVVKQVAFAGGNVRENVRDMVPSGVAKLIENKIRELSGDGDGKVKNPSPND